jgi:hypothetical protein
MAASWSKLCRGRDIEVDEPHIVVRLAQGRQHRVSVEETNDAYVLTAIVLRPAAAAAIADLPTIVWQRNRGMQLAGFRLDARGRLMGEARVPRIGLTAAEFEVYLRTLAGEADRFEYTLTGRDVE